MKISEQMKTALIAALSTQREAVVAERKRRAEDCSRKWNDNDEKIAIALDAKRDQLDFLI